MRSQQKVGPKTKRINVVLPADTLTVLDRIARKGNRSALIDRAIRCYIQAEGRRNLRERLKHEAMANAVRDLEIAAAWCPLEEEAWPPAQSQQSGK